MKTTYHGLIKWVLCWEICPKFGYLCGRTEVLLVRSISREMQIWHSSTQGQILHWKKKSLDWSRAKKIYSSWRSTPTLLVMMCVWIRCFACPRQTKESHLLTVIQWPFFLSLKQYVSPIRFPNLHYQRKTQNHWAWLASVSWLWYCSKRGSPNCLQWEHQPLG